MSREYSVDSSNIYGLCFDPTSHLFDTSPLFVTTSCKIKKDDLCRVCRSLYTEYPIYYEEDCECNPAEQRVKYWRMIVSIQSNPVKTTPNDSSYFIMIQAGTADNPAHLTEILSGTTEDLICSFTISSTLDDSDDPIRGLVRDHVTFTDASYVFPKFRGLKPTPSYVLHFQTLVHALKSAPTIHVPKETPHFGKKKKALCK
jgi:hypothetical protein